MSRSAMMRKVSCLALGAVILMTFVLATPMPVLAADPEPSVAPIEIDGLEFSSWSEYTSSDYFKAAGGRCATAESDIRSGGLKVVDPSDCSASSTNPSSDYAPTVLYEIPVVVHILMNNACTQGVISDAQVASQIQILNEDFLALTGSNGGNGNDAQVRFVLASQDPSGNPTTGITRDCNTTWFNDGGNYWNTLAWDPNEYMNIYTNQAGGALGYVPFLPADGGGAFVGGNSDRVVILWSSFGLNGPIGPPYNKGRTATHEVGHYLGLEHTFNGGCGTASQPGCYSSGDLICDTNAESSPTFSPCFLGAKSSCGSVDPSDNYMDYSDDLCMEQFSVEQGRRVRCSLLNYRPNLYNVVGAGYNLSLTPGQAGVVNTWATTGGTSGETTYFIYGTQTGTVNVPGCPGVTVGIRNLEILATDVADGGGNASYSRSIPAGLSGHTFLFQAVELNTCTVSNLLTSTF